MCSVAGVLQLMCGCHRSGYAFYHVGSDGADLVSYDEASDAMLYLDGRKPSVCEREGDGTKNVSEYLSTTCVKWIGSYASASWSRNSQYAVT